MKRPLLLALALQASLSLPHIATAAQYEWTFNGGTLTDAFGNGLFEPTGATVPNIINTNGITIPHIGGVPATVLDVPAFTSPLDGFNLSLNASVANGGGAFLNQYTFVFDLYSPGARNWQALFQTNPDNPSGNDADWYIAPDGSVGIGALTYSAADVFQQETWHRVAFTADLGAGITTFYLDGIQIAQRSGASLLDGRFALNSSLDAGQDVRLFNEGDTSGDYTHALYVNSVAFVDRELSAAEVQSLGGPVAGGIFIPEPSATVLCLAGIALLGVRRRR
jgi:hypothetical protein